MELLGCEVEVFIVGLIIFNGNLVDECDDDQVNCYSGIGDDFQFIGGIIVLVIEKFMVIDSII